MRVQAHGDPGVGRHLAHRPQVGQQGVPSGAVQLQSLVVTFLARHRRHHHDVGPGADHPVQGTFDLREGVDGRVVQDQGHETAHGRQPVRGQEPGTLARALGQEAVRAELGGHHTQLVHLGQDALRGSW